MKIAIVVQGRFHAFDLGRALLKRGHDVTLFTNYPRHIVQRFGYPAERVRSFLLHGLISRAAYRIVAWTHWRPEKWINPMFGRWAREQVSREKWDVIHGWSGVSAEMHARPLAQDTLHLIMRGSAHIRKQAAILRAEEDRTGIRLDPPDDWIVKREELEYQAANCIVVLSGFAYRTFVEQGVPREKLRMVPLGVDTSLFRPGPAVIEARCQRILSGEPLRVIYVGALSLRKGIWDIRTMLRSLPPGRFHVRLVGPVLREARALVRELSQYADVVPKQPHAQLKDWYAGSDLFLFPTIEDGFAAVLAQAKANGLPILTTPNCSGPDIISEGRHGWILPIRNAEAFVEKLLWCDANRPALAEMVRTAYAGHRGRDWDDVAADFEGMCLRELAGKRSQEILA